MIYVFRIISNEVDDFIRDIAIDVNSTFFDLHEAIQQTCAFDPAQLASFYLTDEEWDRGLEITLLDMQDVISGNSGSFVMDKMRLNKLINEENPRMVYVFDFFMDRALFIELNEVIMEKNLNAPVVTLRKGDAPSQILDEEVGENVHLMETDLELIEEPSDFGELEDLHQIYGDMDEIL